MARRTLRVLLAEPRGFCAGVERAIEMLESALRTYGPPIYVRHDIVHNPSVVEEFTGRGVVFIEELAHVPAGSRVLFSAHGVPRAVEHEARALGLRTLDATCPLVSKVHHEVAHHVEQGRHVLIVGHAGHVEIAGTAGQVPASETTIIETLDDARRVPLPPGRRFAVVTQTTLSVDDTRGILAELRRRIPQLIEPATSDICYATVNRQAAVKLIAPRCDAVAVLGGRKSSNSRKLVATALAAGCPRSALFERAEDLGKEWLERCATLGISSGASTPEASVDALLARLEKWFHVRRGTVTATVEVTSFRSLPLRRLA